MLSSDRRSAWGGRTAEMKGGGGGEMNWREELEERQRQDAEIAAKMTVGMRVVSTFIRREEFVVRTLTAIAPDETCGSGFRASADGGDPCPHCHRPSGTPINGVDAAWFRPAD